MNNQVLVTLEILLTIVVPLVFLYVWGPWPLRKTIPCLLSIPTFLWYLTYSPLHELSHVAGTYLVGGKVTYVKLIPSFWLGEFARAWINNTGITESWQRLISTGFPYILDVVFLAAGIQFLRPRISKKAFVVGLAFMLFCLRSFFDLVCEAIGFFRGDRGDIYWIAQILGSSLTLLLLTFSIGLSILSILVVLRRFTAFPRAPSPAAT
jgi:hypothetical protein